MKSILTLQLLLFTSFGFCQTNAVEKLRDISNMPYICRTNIGDLGCGQADFWRIVEFKLDAIPHLIEKIDDTTSTSALVPNYGGYYTVGDIAFNAIEEIIVDIPTFELLGIAFDSSDCGYCSYWKHLRSNIENRTLFKSHLEDWFTRNKDNLVWVRDSKVLTCDCSYSHPNKGHYKLIE